jgi:hypothetical protein
MWNYAKLSSLAKSNGGPDKLVQLLIDSGVKKGRWQMVPVAIGAVFAGLAIKPIINYFKAKRSRSQAELEAAKAELIQGIKDYDAAQEQKRDNPDE